MQKWYAPGKKVPGLRILAVETSSSRGSVAISENGQIVKWLEHVAASSHAERVLPMIRQLLADAGWSTNSIDRIGVGVGPGSFVGLRVGIALADGLSLGLDRPLIGVPSLRAMTRAVPAGCKGVRVAIADARRNELFATAVSSDGRELLQATVVQRETIAGLVQSLRQDAVLVGEAAADLDLGWPVLRGPELDLPHANWIAVLAEELEPEQAAPNPLYVRGSGAVLPKLPRSPLQA